MNKFINKLYRLLEGRYGIDELYRFLLIICLILIILDIFMSNIYIRLTELILFTYAMYRVLSKNKVKRRYENKKYLEIKEKINEFFTYQRKKFRDRNTHMYKRCPKCKQRLRLPLKKGVHTVKCPKCQNEFTVKCYRNEKIKVEIVK